MYVRRRIERRLPTGMADAEWKLVVPKAARERVLRESHDVPQAGHLGTDKTFRRVVYSYYWPRLYTEIARYVQHCEVCQRTKSVQRPPLGMMGRRVVEGPWTVVAADIMGPFPPNRSGYAYVLVIQDLFSTWVECCPLRKATGVKIKEALEELVFSRWGTPEVLLTDNGTEFVNRSLWALAEEYGICHATTPPYHPQANPVERVNRVLKTMIVSFIKSDHHLPANAYRESVRSQP